VGEFWPFGRLFILVSLFLKNTKMGYFFPGKGYICIKFDKKIGLATFWAIFSTNTSGRPDCQF
jgi:hypothetical protein